MTYNVEVYVDEIHIKTYYCIPGDSEADAQEYVEENMSIDFLVKEND